MLAKLVSPYRPLLLSLGLLALLVGLLRSPGLSSFFKRREPYSLEGKSVYFVFVDRFAQTGDGEASDECASKAAWCGGTLKGLESQLDYIEGMGFDAVWITPVVQQRNGVQCIDVPGRDKVCQVPYHGFWTENFYAIDAHFGTPEDLLSLSLALKERGMGLVLDMIINHVRPIDDAADATAVRPFDKPEHYNMFGAAPGEGFASYLKHPKVCLPPPGCELGDYTCPGYNPEQVLSGWFYDLADLNHSHPYVSSELQNWGRHMVNKYQIDAIGLDTAAYVPQGFLRALVSVS